MSLRALAEADLGVIVEDSATGFGWAITLTDPEGNTGPFTGLSNDIAEVIDAETGQAVSGRSAAVSLRLATLAAEGFTMPKGIADSNRRPWLVEFADINGNPYKFKITESNPDRALGLVTCKLEAYK